MPALMVFYWKTTWRRWRRRRPATCEGDMATSIHPPSHPSTTENLVTPLSIQIKQKQKTEEADKQMGATNAICISPYTTQQFNIYHPNQLVSQVHRLVTFLPISTQKYCTYSRTIFYKYLAQEVNYKDTRTRSLYMSHACG